MDFGQTPKNLARDDVESICQVFHFMVSLGLFNGESIELTFETTNQRSHAASSFMALTNRSWIGSRVMILLAIGLKDSCLRLPHRTVC